MNFHASFVNLDHRTDRLAHMEAELKRIGLEATRLRGMPWQEYDGDESKIQVMMNRTPGAIGCHFSQVQVMWDALFHGKHAMVLEDDLVFCSDFWERMAIIEEFTNTHEWDVFWLGGTYHYRPTWHNLRNGRHTHEDMQHCSCDWGIDWTNTDDKRIRRTFGAWSTHAYIVNVKSIEKVLGMLDENLHLSQGIDHNFLRLEPFLHTYAFVPGIVKQIDSQSDIGNGVTEFSRFESLGRHWWADRM